ncbi:uncharacterized protein V1510DRAFT_400798 [Dipodascopsis tothii]|uniref:uncharacterized protein n=1 Tax=Dipodascopsis tothii TaxID=44089 RepID=UPI0034CD4227
MTDLALLTTPTKPRAERAPDDGAAVAVSPGFAADSESEDEDTLRTQVEALRAQLAVVQAKLARKTQRPAEPPSPSPKRKVPAKVAVPAGSDAAKRARRDRSLDRPFDKPERPDKLFDKHLAQVEIPSTPPKRRVLVPASPSPQKPAATAESVAAKRKSLGLDRGVNAHDVSLRRAPRPAITFAVVREPAAAPAAAAPAASFAERFMAQRRQQRDREEQAARLREARVKGFGLADSAATATAAAAATAEAATAQDADSDDDLEVGAPQLARLAQPASQPASQPLSQPASQPAPRPDRPALARSASQPTPRPQPASHTQAAPPRPASRAAAGATGSAARATGATGATDASSSAARAAATAPARPPPATDTDPTSKLALSSRYTPAATVASVLADKAVYTVASVCAAIKPPDYNPPAHANWVVVGAVATKSPVRETRGRGKFFVLTLTDLRVQVDVFVLGKAFERLPGWRST